MSVAIIWWVMFAFRRTISSTLSMSIRPFGSSRTSNMLSGPLGCSFPV